MLYLDTNIVIYVVEQHPVFGPKALLRIGTAQAAGLSLQVSDLTRMECLVGPLKASDIALEQQFGHGLRLPG